MSKNWKNVAERGTTTVINAVNLSKPDYKPLELPSRTEEVYDTPRDRSDVSVLGGLLVKSGITLATISAAAELLPESAETATRLGMASGLGAAAIGALIVGYEKINS